MSIFRWTFLTLSLFSTALLGQQAPAGQNAVVPGAIRIDPPTLHSIGVRWYVEGDDNGDAVCTLAYRAEGAETWLQGQPLLRVNRETVDRDFDSYGTNSGIYTVGNLLAGSVLFLQPDTDYQIRLQLSDPDGGQGEFTETVRTRAVPYAPPPRRTLHVYPPDFSGARQEPAFATVQSAFDGARPGDLLLLYPGDHAGGVALATSGTATAPITIRGVGQARLVGPADGVNLALDDRAHVFVEELVLSGGRMAIRAQRARYLTVRGCTIEDVKFGLYNDRAESTHWYIADNTITGIDEHWVPRNQDDAAETGINVFGRGHVVEYNRISRFWDCLAIADFGRPPGGIEGIDRHCVAIDFNNNDLARARDDLLETDFGSHNIRVWDNRLFNGHMGCSVQPLYGGPVYFVGNAIYGFIASPFKLHNWPAGILLFNNTSIGSGKAFGSAPLWQNATFRNNLFLGAEDNYSMESGSPDSRTSLDYNGWSRQSNDPGRFIKFTDDGTLTGASQFRFATLADFYAGTGNGEHSIEVDIGVFEQAAYPEAGVSYEPEAVDLQLRDGAGPVDAGVVLANITRQVNGAAPDMGAYERGAPLPHFGPRPRPLETVVEEWVDEAGDAFVLRQNAPNPFNSSTVLAFELAADGGIELVVYNMAGQQQAVLVQGWRRAGAYRVQWDGRDDEGRPLASGAYVVLLQAGGQVQERVLMLVR
ncbi:MAG: hypothetical protein GKR89_04065 [Candidatus Latescibacteria bacterium]|nr:hypothetical protein [Candidatus Latescibacterota bacterium]